MVEHFNLDDLSSFKSLCICNLGNRISECTYVTGNCYFKANLTNCSNASDSNDCDLALNDCELGLNDCDLGLNDCDLSLNDCDSSKELDLHLVDNSSCNPNEYSNISTITMNCHLEGTDVDLSTYDNPTDADVSRPTVGLTPGCNEGNCQVNIARTELGTIQSAGIFSEVNENNDNENEFMSEGQGTFHDLRVYKCSHAKNILIGYLNINGLLGKFAEFSEILSDDLVDVMGVAETKIDDTVLDSVINIKNYKLYRQDGTRTAHGLAIYVRSDLTHCRRRDLERNFGSSQYIIIELWLKKQRWFVVSIYKPPSVKNSIFIEELGLVCEQLLRDSSNLVLIGDMNIDMKQTVNNQLLSFCDNYGLKNIVEKPTCFKSRDKESLIDVILVSQPKRLNETLVFDTGLSDFHRLICTSTKLHAPKRVPRNIVYRSFRNFDEVSYKEDIEKIPFHISKVFDDIDDITWCHEHLLLDIVNTHAPLKHRTLQRDSLPFMNSAWRKVIFRRNQLRNKFWKQRNRTNWENYRKMRNLANKLRKESEMNYFRERSLKSDPKDFWKCFKPYLSSKCRSGTDSIILKEGDQVITKPSDVCNILKDHYESVANDIGEPDTMGENLGEDEVLCAIQKHSEHPSVLRITGTYPRPDHFSFTKVTVDQVLLGLKKVNAKKATGYDNLSPYFIKLAANEICIPITNLVNECIAQGKYPDMFKRNEIIPVFKSKDSFDKANYRPVSCTTALSKIIEKQLVTQIDAHFQKYFSNKLSAYRKGMGCEHVIINVIEDWKLALDKNKIVGSLLMDLSKAFDCLPHRLLIAKLSAYGFSLKACQLMASYLANRKQRVKYFGEKSNWSVVNKGIPQGSVLGPVMYNIFVNDLMFTVKEDFYNYADDNTIAVVGDSLSEVLERLEDTAKICLNWFSVNMMKANPEKFQLIVLDRNCQDQNQLSLKINEIAIPQVTCVKLLGIQIDCKLEFTEHVNALCKKAGRNLKILLRMSKRIRNIQDRYCLMESFLLSCFSYCQIVWHFCNRVLSHKMEKLYERGIRFAENDYVTEYDDLLQKTEKSTFIVNRLRNIAMFVFNCMQNATPEYLRDLYRTKDQTYSMRDRKILDVTRFNTIKYGKNSLKYTGTKMWNSLPQKIKCHTESDLFKRELFAMWVCKERQCQKCIEGIYH